MNRIFPEQLASNLNSHLAKVYFLVGTDPLLLSESEDLIHQSALLQGFDEKNQITIDTNTDWPALIEASQSMGLFFNKQVFILNLPENLTTLLQKNLLQFISGLNEDSLLVLTLPKLSKAAEKQEWFIQAKQLLCYSYENNLLALKQALQLLDLLYPDHKLTYNRVKSVVEQSSVFTPFQWIDALLSGKANRSKRILRGLQAEDVQPVILLRTLQRELLTLLELTKPQLRNPSLNTSLPTQTLKADFDRLKIWQNRRHLYTAAIQRLTYQKLFGILQELADIERITKQEYGQDVWVKLADLSVKICL